MPLFLLSNWKLLAGIGLAVLFAVAFWLAHREGYKSGRHDCEVAFQIQVENQREKDQEKSDAAGKDLAEKDAEAEVIYRTIEKKVDRIIKEPVYIRDCFDVSGLEAANQALAGNAE